MLDGVFEFSNVAGPAVAHDQSARLRRYAFEGPLASFGVLRGEVEGEQGNIIAVLAQRRDGNGDYVEAVVEVLSELGGFNGLLEIFVGGGENASFEGYGMSSADAFELSLLKDSQKLGLHGRRELTDFVKEEGSICGGLKFAFSCTDGSCECALLMSEELAFDEGFGDCGAVDSDEGVFAPRAVLMNGTCDDFFAGAALAADENGGVAGGDFGDECL